MDNELVTTQKGIDKLPKPEIGFEFLQLPPQAENMREEIEKSAGYALFILSEMGFQFSQKIPLKIVDESTYIDEFYESTEAYYKALINFMLYPGIIRLEKDNDGKWKDKIIMPLKNRFIQRIEEVELKASLAHELAHLWMFQETQFGKEIFPIRERIAEQINKDTIFYRKVVTTFGEISPEFYAIISDVYFRSLSGRKQYDVVIKSLQDILKETVNICEVGTELFSQDCMTDSFERGKTRVKLALLRQEYLLKENHNLQELYRNYKRKSIGRLEIEKLREDISDDEKLTQDYVIHSVEVDLNNKLGEQKLEELFLENGTNKFYVRMQELVIKADKGNSVNDEAEKLIDNFFVALENIMILQDTNKQYISEPRMVSYDEGQQYNNLRLFKEGFAEFAEEKFLDEYRRRNPDVHDVLSNQKLHVDELDLTSTTNMFLSPYIKGLTLFKSKYTTVREAMDAIRAMSIEQIQKEFLS